MVFEGLTSEDFEQYLPERRTSAMYTLKRRAVKEKLVAISEAIQAQLGEALQGLSPELSDEAPGLTNKRCVDRQWLTFQRDAEAQSRLRIFLNEIKLSAPDALDVALFRKHAHLAVVVDERFLETSLRVQRRARLDRENLAARMKEGWARERLVELLRACGAGFTFGLVDDRELPETQVEAVAPDDVPGLLADGAERGWLVVAATCSIEDAVALGADVSAACAERLAPLLELYRFAAWSPDNDHIAAKKAIKEAKAASRQSFKKGERVRILAGMWSGRTGAVEEVDKKGRVKVAVGLVSVWVEEGEATSI